MNVFNSKYISVVTTYLVSNLFYRDRERDVAELQSKGKLSLDRISAKYI